jgi:hypothetical protein
MARRTKGRFAGEYRQDAGEPEEVNAAIDVESDTTTGVVRTTIRERETEIRSHRAAMTVAYMQHQLLSAEQQRRHATRPIVPVPKPAGTRPAKGGVPAGYVVCPDCGSGLADAWDCSRCEGRGIVRDPHRGD